MTGATGKTTWQSPTGELDEQRLKALRTRHDGAASNRWQPLHDAGHEWPRRSTGDWHRSTTPARCSDFYWVSSPRARHSRNLEQCPAVEIVIFDSTAPVGQGEAVYIAATVVLLLRAIEPPADAKVTMSCAR